MATLTRGEIAKLSVAERLKLIDMLWDSVIEQQDDTPVPSWQLEILEERLRTFRKDPGQGRAWQDVKKTLQARRRNNG